LEHPVDLSPISLPVCVSVRKVFEGAVLGVNVGRPVETNWDVNHFIALSCDSDAFFPNYFRRTCFIAYSRSSSSTCM